MKREHLEHILRAASQIAGDPDVLVIGSQSILGTFTEHELAPGARVKYHMTGPDGEVYPGYWDITGVEPTSRFTFQDGFAKE